MLKQNIFRFNICCNNNTRHTAEDTITETDHFAQNNNSLQIVADWTYRSNTPPNQFRIKRQVLDDCPYIGPKIFGIF